MYTWVVTVINDSEKRSVIMAAEDIIAVVNKVIEYATETDSSSLWRAISAVRFDAQNY